MSRAILNSSAIIALSALGYIGKLKQVFTDVLIARSIYEEICVRGHGLMGEHELQEAVKDGLKADYVLIDDKLVRRRAKSMRLNVIGTLRGDLLPTLGKTLLKCGWASYASKACIPESAP